MYDVIIVGAGPAGSAAALELARRRPDARDRILVLDKAQFPRLKLCGGGITAYGLDMLHKLDLDIGVPSFPIHRVRVQFEDLTWTLHWNTMFQVVRREEFDHYLMGQVRARGICVQEGEAVLRLDRGPDRVTVRTTRGEYAARMVIGADGANSVVRKELGLVRWDRISRLLEILTPEEAPVRPEFRDHLAVFDFTPVLRGVQGYYWDFPSLRQGAPHMNRGLFDSRVRPDRPRADMVPALAGELGERGIDLDTHTLQGHPERWYDPRAKHSAPRVLLAGDAAGADPLLGEGISYALDFGRRAGQAAAEALEREDFEFSDYERIIRASSLGRTLWRNRLVAGIVYGNRGRWFYRFGFRMLGLVFR